MLRIILFFFNQFSYISSKVAVSVIFRQSSSLWICTIFYLHDLFLFDTHIWEIILIIVCVSADILMLEFFTREIGIIPKESSIGQRRDKTTPWYRTWTWQRPKLLLPLRTQRTYSKCWFWEYWSFNKLRWIFFLYLHTNYTQCFRGTILNLVYCKIKRKKNRFWCFSNYILGVVERVFKTVFRPKVLKLFPLEGQTWNVIMGQGPKAKPIVSYCVKM